jgi:hypothetical protein
MWHSVFVLSFPYMSKDSILRLVLNNVGIISGMQRHMREDLNFSDKSMRISYHTYVTDFEFVTCRVIQRPTSLLELPRTNLDVAGLRREKST